MFKLIINKKIPPVWTEPTVFPVPPKMTSKLNFLYILKYLGCGEPVASAGVPVIVNAPIVKNLSVRILNLSLFVKLIGSSKVDV